MQSYYNLHLLFLIFIYFNFKSVNTENSCKAYLITIVNRYVLNDIKMYKYLT